jgi:hypothetical protein
MCDVVLFWFPVYGKCIADYMFMPIYRSINNFHLNSKVKFCIFKKVNEWMNEWIPSFSEACIVIYACKKNQQDAHFFHWWFNSVILFSMCFKQLSVHHQEVCTSSLYCCFYCCTVHSKDSLIIKTNKCTNMYCIYSKTHIKTLKKLLHVSIYRSSSGSTCSSLLKYVKMLK